MKCFNIRHDNNIKAPNIDGKVDHANICNIFSEKFKKVFASNKSQSNEINFKDKNKYGNFSFSKATIKGGIHKLKCGIGMDGIHSNHLKFCPDSLYDLFSQLFESFVVHQYAPMSLIQGMITPTIKDSMGDITNSNNYRPVMSSSVILKLLEYCLETKIGPYIELCDSQHGFRPNHSTTTAFAVLKETIFNYHQSNSDIYGCFIDISKAFDTVDHTILMRKLLSRGVPGIYVNFMKNWYSNQVVNVRYLSCVSEGWIINSGVRQGGVLSGLLFGLYVDSLLCKVNKNKYGCKLGIHKSNIVAYADDILLLAPSAKSLQILINEAALEAKELKLKFNKEKSKWMLFRTPGTKGNDINDMQIENDPIEQVNTFKYLGFEISNDLNEVNDIKRAMRKFYCQFNGILRKFSSVDVNVKLYLFKTYCVQIYGSDMWLNNRGSSSVLKQFSVGYHKAIKRILGLSTHESNHFVCQEARILTFNHFLNRSKIMTAIRLLHSPCNYFRKIMPFLNMSSFFRSRIKDLCQREYGIHNVFENDIDAIDSRIKFVQNHEETMR